MSDKLSASQRKIAELQGELNFYQVAFAAAVVELGGRFFMTEAKYLGVPPQIVRRVSAEGVSFETMPPMPEEVQ